MFLSIQESSREACETVVSGGEGMDLDLQPVLLGDRSRRDN